MAKGVKRLHLPGSHPPHIHNEHSSRCLNQVSFWPSWGLVSRFPWNGSVSRTFTGHWLMVSTFVNIYRKDVCVCKYIYSNMYMIHIYIYNVQMCMGLSKNRVPDDSVIHHHFPIGVCSVTPLQTKKCQASSSKPLHPAPGQGSLWHPLNMLLHPHQMGRSKKINWGSPPFWTNPFHSLNRPVLM